jgi:uncharacterized phosphosugar-binding protein
VASREASTVDPRGRVTGVLGVEGGQSGIRLRHSLDDRVADVVLDNGGCVVDAAVDIEGLDRPVAPTSTVVGAAILNAVVAEAVHLLVDRGFIPDVCASSNTRDGGAANARFAHPAAHR